MGFKEEREIIRRRGWSYSLLKISNWEICWHSHATPAMLLCHGICMQFIYFLLTFICNEVKDFHFFKKILLKSSPYLILFLLYLPCNWLFLNMQLKQNNIPQISQKFLIKYYTCKFVYKENCMKNIFGSLCCIRMISTNVYWGYK